MPHRRVRRAAAAASVLLALAALAACAPESGTGSSPSPVSSATATESATPTPIPTRADPTPTAGARPDLPTDCRAILTDDVLDQLAGTPLNDPAFGSSGVQPDGSLICIWGDPAADTTALGTTITYVSRGPALDMLNQLADEEGFTCFTPDGGTRCEKTWPNETYPVIDGRTLFWREDVLIDTKFSNLAPTGYTSAIIAYIFG